MGRGRPERWKEKQGNDKTNEPTEKEDKMTSNHFQDREGRINRQTVTRTDVDPSGEKIPHSASCESERNPGQQLVSRQDNEKHTDTRV